ncbi:zinc ribbon domain-containing protein [Planotetraspora sp. GP83]|uniref:zinc ribbon domain-containing protein n=1 Tax=Planotetraspora sp. GP83 TaxID=3156264 RepID=UPI003514A229
MPRLHSLSAGLAALGVLITPLLHPHPSGSTDRVTPGAVRVESASHVSITLLDDRSVIQQAVREYDTDLAEGSGFTVTPDGVVVTATGVVQASRDPRVYAANRVFAEYFKVKIPADFSRHSLKDADLDRRLQACYPPQGANSTCIATVTTKVTVFPYLDPPLPEGLPAQILTTGASPAAPAVLKLTKGGEKETLPTVPLGTTIGSAVASLDVMTLTGRPSAKLPPKLDTAHLDPPGSRTFKADEHDKLAALLKQGAAGAALIDDGRSEVVGLLAGGGDLPQTITPADEIRTALVAAGVTPRRGPVDVVYENALASYHNKLYGSAIPVLQQVLNLRSDHAVALDHLRAARAKAGTAEDAGRAVKAAAPQPKKAAAVSPLVWVTGGLVVLGLLAAVAVPVLLRRRRTAGTGGGTGGGAGDAPAQEPVPVASWPPHPPTPGANPSANPGATQVFEAPRPETSRPPGTLDTPRPGEVSDPPGTSRPPVHISGPGQSGSSRPVPVPQPQRPGDSSPPRGPAQMKFCTQCGMRLGQGHRFCGFCGHPADS